MTGLGFCDPGVTWELGTPGAAELVGGGAGAACLCQRAGALLRALRTAGCGALSAPFQALGFIGPVPALGALAGSRSSSAAGFTPAKMAALAAAGDSGACRSVPRRSGFTMICRS